MAEFSKLGGSAPTETRTESCDKHGNYESKAFGIGSRIMHWTRCPTCNQEKQAEESAAAERKESEQRQARIEARMSRAGIPLRYRTKDFASYIADTDGKEKARAAAMEFANNFAQHRRRGTVAVFSGLPGTGKSHLAIAIAQQVMQHGTALYSSAIDAVRMIRDTWRRDSEQTESQVLHMLSTIDLLVLDEVGVQYGTEAEQVSLFDIIDKRYRDLMPTILLTNQNKAGMKTFLGDRSFDRLREGGIWVTFDWESQRSKMAA
jgi:DNA replication protein DnaC